jgi:glycosyltransferase involved in cell wall biosynthesis
VLSWSLIQAMAAGCSIVASATAPVLEAIDDGVHGLLAGFDDVDGLTQRGLKILHDPAALSHLGAAAHQRVLERYEMNHCMTELVRYFEQVAGRGAQ